MSEEFTSPPNPLPQAVASSLGEGEPEKLTETDAPPLSVRNERPGEGVGGRGNVVAVGVDLADVERVRKALARFPERFVERVLTESEAAYCMSKPDPAPHITARFAAKEAVIKCLGGGCDLKDIEVKRALSGAPSITLSGRAAEKAAGRKVLISLSHLPDIACAFATLVETV